MTENEKMSGESEYFEKGVMALIALIANREECEARIAELRRVSTDNDKAAAELAAREAAHEAKVASDKAELAEERRRAAGVWKVAQEADRAATAKMERAERFAAKAGYHESPSSIPFVTGGDGCMAVLDEAPALPEPAAPALEMVAEPFKAGLSGGRMVARPRGRGRA
jgi:hypothetical protein